MAHLRSVPRGARQGFCARGARAWFARHGLAWPAFLREGIEADTLLQTRDPLARELVEHAIACEGVQRGR